MLPSSSQSFSLVIMSTPSNSARVINIDWHNLPNTRSSERNLVMINSNTIAYTVFDTTTACETIPGPEQMLYLRHFRCPEAAFLFCAILCIPSIGSSALWWWRGHICVLRKNVKDCSECGNHWNLISTAAGTPSESLVMLKQSLLPLYDLYT